MARPRQIDDAEVLAAARRLFIANGAEATTRDIAEAAKVSQAVLFQRYRSKEALFFAAMLPQPPELDALVGALPEAGAEHARQHLVHVSERLLIWLDASLPGSLRAMLHPDFPDSMGRVHAPAGHRGISAALADRLKSLKRRGDLAADINIERAVTVLVEMLHGCALTHLMSADGRSPRQRAENAVKILWSGFSPPDAFPDERSSR